jgi:hypothetical protein
MQVETPKLHVVCITLHPSSSFIPIYGPPLLIAEISLTGTSSRLAGEWIRIEVQRHGGFLVADVRGWLVKNEIDSTSGLTSANMGLPDAT